MISIDEGAFTWRWDADPDVYVYTYNIKHDGIVRSIEDFISDVCMYIIFTCKDRERMLRDFAFDLSIWNGLSYIKLLRRGYE